MPRLLSSLFLLAAMGVHQAQAYQLELSREQLCTLSPKVVVAEVSSAETLWAAGEEGALETRVWLTGLYAVKGPAEDTLELILPGGVLDGLTHWVEDVPKLNVDQAYLFFLREDEDGRLSILGGEQGAVFLQQWDGGPGETAAQAVQSLGACHVR